jgi:hypothetical protein
LLKSHGQNRELLDCFGFSRYQFCFPEDFDWSTYAGFVDYRKARPAMMLADGREKVSGKQTWLKRFGSQRERPEVFRGK